MNKLLKRRFVRVLLSTSLLLTMFGGMVAQACPLQLELDVVADATCDGPTPMFSVTASATPSWKGWVLQGITGEKSGPFTGPTEPYKVVATWAKEVKVTPGYKKCTCDVKAWIHGTKRDVSRFYIKPTGDNKHCHRIVWKKLSTSLKNQFKAMHNNNYNYGSPNHGGWKAAYNTHIKQNPGVKSTCVFIPPVYKTIYESRTEEGILQRPNCGEQCGRCSTVFEGWVTWYDRDGGCDGDYYNERHEFPFDKRCYGACAEGNLVPDGDIVWGDWINPLNGTAYKEGYQPMKDVNTGEVCEAVDVREEKCAPRWTGEWIITILQEKGGKHYRKYCTPYVPDAADTNGDGRISQKEAEAWEWSDAYLAQLCPLECETKDWKKGEVLYVKREFKTCDGFFVSGNHCTTDVVPGDVCAMLE